MFFQFFVRRHDLNLCTWNAAIDMSCMPMDDSEHSFHPTLLTGVWMCQIRVRTMNQGGRNSSKIACCFAEEWLDAWRQRLDDFVADWILRQTPAMQEAHATRSRELGLAQARPFWAGVYTDNFDFSFVGPELHAAGSRAFGST
jgi:hypothetical protein